MTFFELLTVTILTGILGLCVGSFLNVVIYRLPRHMSLATPRSHCPGCGYQLKWYDNIPVVSYLLLGGKCRNCGMKISIRYTVVELLNTFLWLACLFIFLSNLKYAAVAALACSVMVCIACIDIENYIIPDSLQLVLLGLSLFAIPFDWFTNHWSHLIGAAAAFVLFMLISVIAEKIFKKEALGGGDIKLVTVSGLFLGWEKLLLMLLLASVVGSIVLLILRNKRGDEKLKEYPFGPFLAFGFITALLFGADIITAYLSLLA